MPRLAAALSILLPLAVPAGARPEPPRAEGRIVSDVGRTEILGRPIRVGEKLELPEGFIRVEEAGTEDGEVGSFTVVSAEAMGGEALAAGPTSTAAAEDPAPRPAQARDCRAERARYLAELWRLSGIEVPSPDALIEGLEGAAGGAETGFYWFALATDPFRPLAWSSELRGRAEALARCVRGE